MAKLPHLVGLLEITEMMGVQSQTAYHWRTRGVMPEPDLVVSKTPLWRYDRIVEWAGRTGRSIHRRLDSPN
jgi:hypothetical protein